MCGETYDNLRTGLTYVEVYKMLWSPNPDPSTWRYKRRNTVLGFWHQLKQDMWKEHLHWCAEQKAHEERQEECPF